MTKKFCISISTEIEDGSVKYECKSSSWDEAFYVLIQNGWTENQAKHDLLGCSDNWILVNSCTQIS